MKPFKVLCSVLPLRLPVINTLLCHRLVFAGLQALLFFFHLHLRPSMEFQFTCSSDWWSRWMDCGWRGTDDVRWRCEWRCEMRDVRLSWAAAPDKWRLLCPLEMPEMQSAKRKLLMSRRNDAKIERKNGGQNSTSATSQSRSPFMCQLKLRSRQICHPKRGPRKKLGAKQIKLQNIAHKRARRRRWLDKNSLQFPRERVHQFEFPASEAASQPAIQPTNKPKPDQFEKCNQLALVPTYVPLPTPLLKRS